MAATAKSGASKRTPGHIRDAHSGKSSKKDANLEAGLILEGHSDDHHDYDHHSAVKSRRESRIGSHRAPKKDARVHSLGRKFTDPSLLGQKEGTGEATYFCVRVF